MFATAQTEVVSLSILYARSEIFVHDISHVRVI